MNRYSILIAWESGSWLVAVWEIMMKALIKESYYVVADREYPSLIRGWHACYKLQFSDAPISGLTKENDMLICVDRVGLMNYYQDLKLWWILIHGDERHDMMENICNTIKEKKYKHIFLPERKTVYEIGGNLLMTNILMTWISWRILGLNYDAIEKQVQEKFASKPELLKIDLQCLAIWYWYEWAQKNALEIFSGKNTDSHNLYDGNHALALWAIAWWMTHYYAYPMSPSSTILTHISHLAQKHNITLKQWEDEISVVQMALWSMHMWARTLCATSGWWFDLMVETISLSGMIETPLVVINAQRPGPATWLPTWTAQADLDIAIYSGHGEYARMVYAISDAEHAYCGITEAMNYAEELHIPVVVLTEKTIAETNISLPDFDNSKIEIKRWITQGSDVSSSSERYSYENPLWKRWLPGSSDYLYYANGDEHREDGVLCEDEVWCQKMANRRLDRMKLVQESLPKPEILWRENAEISFVWWGSTKMIIRDILTICEEQNISCNYLHFNVVFPLEESVLWEFMNENKNIHLIEWNLTGQLWKLIEQKWYNFKNKFLKCDGRPFYIEELLEYIHTNK